MVEHSIAVCNYNMAETLEASLRSMLDQVDETYEMVVVDGGSTDGSVEILRRLAAEYDRMRVIERSPDPDQYLGGDRNLSFEAADGDYVLESLDTDDYYRDDTIQNFVEIFHQIRDQVSFDFYLSGTGINIAPRSLLLEVPYRNLGGAEDRDLWRRLLARDALIWLDHRPIAEQIGYEKGPRAQLRRDLHGKICDFQTGITFRSAVRWTLHHEHYYILEDRRRLPAEFIKRVYDLVTLPYAWVKASRRERWAAPSGFERKGALERTIAEQMVTLSELERQYDISIDRDRLTETGRAYFDR